MEKQLLAAMGGMKMRGGNSVGSEQEEEPALFKENRRPTGWVPSARGVFDGGKGTAPSCRVCCLSSPWVRPGGQLSLGPSAHEVGEHRPHRPKNVMIYVQGPVQRARWRIRLPVAESDRV